MALSPRPSNSFSNKRNVNPSLDRLTEVAAEDFQELTVILNYFADRFDGMVQPERFYGFHTSLPVLQAAYPDAEENGWAVIVPVGAPQYVATFSNGVWTATAVVAPIQFFNTKADRPDPGVSGVFYVVKDEKILYLWYDGGYKPFGKDGSNGMSAYQVAVAFGFAGTEPEWLETLQGKDNYQLWLDAGNVGTYADFFEASRGPKGDKGDTGIPGAGFENIPAEVNKIPVTDGVGGLNWEDKPTGGTGGGTAPIAYTDMAALYAGQSNQIANGNYRVDDASAHPDVEAGRAWFDYKGTTAGDHTDYILKSEEESLNLDAQLTAIENTLTNHEQRIANLENGGGNDTTVVNTSRALTANDSGKKLWCNTAGVILTWPANGIANFKANFETAESGTITIEDEAATPGDDLDGLTFLAENSMGHASARPDNGKLSLKGDWE